MVVSSGLGWFIIVGSAIGITIGGVAWMAKKDISERYFFLAMLLGTLVGFLLYRGQRRIYEYTPEKNMEVKMAFWTSTWESDDNQQVTLDRSSDCCIVNASDVPLVIEYIKYGQIYLPGSGLTFIDPNTYKNDCTIPDYLPTEYPPESVTVDDRSGLGFDIQSWVREASVKEQKGRAN